MLQQASFMLMKITVHEWWTSLLKPAASGVPHPVHLQRCPQCTQPISFPMWTGFSSMSKRSFACISDGHCFQLTPLPLTS